MNTKNDTLTELSEDLLNQISGGKDNKEKQEKQEKQDRKDTMERYVDFLINYD